MSLERNIITQNLIEAKEQAEESDRLKSAFLASISHEIRTPLNAIVGFASLITMDMPKNYQGYYEIIQQNSNILTTLIDDILESSKIEVGLLKIKISDCSANALCSSTIETFQQLISHKIELVFLAPSEDVVCQTDISKLKQILDNLLSNAVKFTQEGKITLSYHAETDSIIFSIQDTGIGIPEAKFKDIFTRFTKLDPYIQGTGLGLSITKRLVETLGGQIWVESELGVGSTFFVKLPRNFTFA